MTAKVNRCTSADTEQYSCMNCSMRKHSLIDELSLKELEVLNKNRYVVSYNTGESICKEGTKSPGLICLNEGKVKITRRGTNGTEQIVSLKKPVDFIGFRALVQGNVCSATATAMEDVTVCIIDKNDFFKIVEDNNQLAFKIIRLLASELNESDNRMINLTHKHIRARLADALLMVNDFFGTLPDKETLNVPLKRSDLAALSNMTTANAIRVLSSFARENIVELNQRDIKIKNLKALKDISIFGR